MNLNRKHLKMACLTSVVVMLAACSNSAEIKPDSMSEVIKPVQPQKDKVASVPEPASVAKVAPVKQPEPQAKSTNATVKAVKSYVPPKPIVVAVHQKRKAQKTAAAPTVKQARSKAKPLSRPLIQKKAVVPSVSRKPIYTAAAPQVRPAAIPTRTAKRPTYVAPKQTRTRASIQQASYRPAPKPQRLARPAVQRSVAPVNYGQSYLSGDFAGNRQAEAFVNKMVSQHGFDRSYVTGVISQAKATKWLRKMAFSDANPHLRKKSGKKPSWSRYRSRFITSRHINAGTAFYKKYRRSLERAASQYGVPSEYILGIMGVETIYGGNVGTDRALDALATMSFMNARRGRYFESELEAYLLMTRRTGLNPLQPKASYAGALGLPQFMPSNIKKYGVDYDGDGAVNLWTPHDAIGSIANYLSKHGWKSGEIAAIPAKRTGGRGYSSMKWGFKHKYSLTKLSRKGLAPVYPGVSGKVHMLKLKTNKGHEYWIGGNNFYTITRYNHSSFYAMAVHQLAQEIRKRVKPERSLPRVIEAHADQDLLRQAASSLL